MADTVRTAEIAEQVRAQAARRRLTVAEIGRQTGIGRVTIQRKMRGASEFTALELEKVAAVLGVPVADLYERPRTTTPPD